MLKQLKEKYKWSIYHEHARGLIALDDLTPAGRWAYRELAKVGLAFIIGDKARLVDYSFSPALQAGVESGRVVVSRVLS